MSLIDRVLRDLEDRSALTAAATPSVIGDLRSAQDYAQHERRLQSRLALTIAIVATLAAFGFLLERNMAVPGILSGKDSGYASPESDAASATRPVGPHAAVAPVVKAAAANPQAVRGGAALALRLDTAMLAVAAPTEVAAGPEGSGNLLTGISHRSTETESSIHLDLTAVPEYRLYVLQNPDRLLVQVSHIDFAPAVVESFRPDGLVKGLRFAQQGNLTKLIFDLSGPVLIETAGISEQAQSGYAFNIGLSSLGSSPGTPSHEVETAAFRDEPKSSPPAIAVPMQKKLRDSNPQSAAADDFSKGLESYRLGDAANATAFFRKVLAANPRHIRARQLLASILVSQKDNEEAKRVLSEGLQYFPGDASLAKSYATILLDDGHPTEALQVLAQKWPAIPADPEYHALAAALFQKQGNHAEAVRVYRELLQFNPARGLWWTGLGISLEALGDRGAALDAYERARTDRSISADVGRYIDQRIEALKRAPT